MKTIVPTALIRLPQYRFYDSPNPASRAATPDEKYMKREEVEAQVKARVLEATSSRSGSILVTGYRGVGKTSLVRKALRDLNALPGGACRRAWMNMRREVFGLGPTRLLVKEINLAQEEIDERAIFRLLALGLLDLLKDVRLRPVDRWNLVGRALPYLLAVIMALATSGLFEPFVVRVFGWCVPDSCLGDWGKWQGLLSWVLQHNPEPGRSGFVLLRLLDALVVPVVVGALVAMGVRQLVQRLFANRMDRSITGLKRRLEVLIARMQASVTTERSGNLGPGAHSYHLSFGFRRSMAFTMAKTKEIELELVDILDTLGQMDNSKSVMRGIGLLCWRMFPGRVKPPNWYKDRSKVPDAHKYLGGLRIVFLIDELDKLIPNVQRRVVEKEVAENHDELGGGTPVQVIEVDLYRKRQEAIATLFANMKHFLSVAQAKFVFVGGREMFDAVLADTSNRDAFFSSVFNHVIHVPTFMKEAQVKNGHRTHGLTTTVERFLCEAILAERVGPTDTKSPGKDEGSDTHLPPTLEDVQQRLREDRTALGLTEAQIGYALGVLQNYAIYLTFRSNGVAKKLVQLFERSIVQLTEEEVRLKKEHDRDLLVIAPPPRAATERRPSDRDAYLRLDPNDQQAHYLLAYFCRPFTSLYSQYYGQLNDKHLISLTYLIDHIFKFHPTAFSFAHLELAPESIAVNKVPEIRQYISDILYRLSIQHIRTIDNGIFGYVYYTRTYREISYLSKVSELDSAAMNFTLDESRPVKDLYRERLQHLERAEKKKPGGHEGAGLNPLADLHQKLGDMHFFDAEYEQALEQYRAAARYYDAPFSRGQLTPAMAADLVEGFAPTKFHEYVKLTLRQVHCLEKMKMLDDAIIQLSSLTSLIRAYARAAGNAGIRGVMDWRLLCLTMVYKPALVDKAFGIGFGSKHLDELYEFWDLVAEEFKTLPGPPGIQPPLPRLTSMLHVHMGSILFYGNREILHVRNGVQVRRHTYKLRYAESVSWLLGPGKGLLLLRDVMNTLDIADVRMWAGRLRVLHERMVSYGPQAPTASKGQEDGELAPAAKMQLIGNSMSKYADALIALNVRGVIQLPGEEQVPKTPAELSASDLDVVTLKGVNVKPLLAHPAFGCVGAHLIMACNAYLYAGQPYQAVFQIKKLLYMISAAKLTGTRDENRLLSATLDELHTWAVSTIHAYNDHIDRLQVMKLQRLGQPSAPENDHLVSYASEIIEMDALRHLAQLLLDRMPQRLEEVRAFLQENQWRVVPQMTRLVLLELCLHYNWLRLDKRVRDQLRLDTAPAIDLAHWQLTDQGTTPKNMERLELIEESILCCYQVISILNLCGIGFLCNHSRFAVAEHMLGNWCLLLRSFEAQSAGGYAAAIQAAMDRLDGAMVSNVGYRCDPLLHLTYAKGHYEKAISMHQGGKAYRRVMGDMFILEDDYADNLYHFSCALERMVINHPGRGHGARIAELDQRIARLERMSAHRITTATLAATV